MWSRPIPWSGSSRWTASRWTPGPSRSNIRWWRSGAGTFPTSRHWGPRGRLPSWTGTIPATRCQAEPWRVSMNETNAALLSGLPGDVRRPPVQVPGRPGRVPGSHVPAAPEGGGRGDQEADSAGRGQQPGRVADARGRLGAAVAAASARLRSAVPAGNQASAWTLTPVADVAFGDEIVVRQGGKQRRG